MIVFYIKSLLNITMFSSRVLQKFFEFVNPRRVFLSVRSDNEINKKVLLKKQHEISRITTS